MNLDTLYSLENPTKVKDVLMMWYEVGSVDELITYIKGGDDSIECWADFNSVSVDLMTNVILDRLNDPAQFSIDLNYGDEALCCLDLGCNYRLHFLWGIEN